MLRCFARFEPADGRCPVGRSRSAVRDGLWNRVAAPVGRTKRSFTTGWPAVGEMNCAGATAKSDRGASATVAWAGSPGKSEVNTISLAAAGTEQMTASAAQDNGEEVLTSMSIDS